MKKIINVDEYRLKEYDTGWTYEAFFKWKNNGESYEIVEEWEHTDHELFTAEVFLMKKDFEALSKLN